MSVLGDFPVLAPGAGEIAAKGADGEDVAAGQKMVQGFLLHRVDVGSDRLAIDNQAQRPLQVAADATFARCVGRHCTPMFAGCALDVAFLERAAEQRRVEHRSPRRTWVGARLSAAATNVLRDQASLPSIIAHFCPRCDCLLEFKFSSCPFVPSRLPVKKNVHRKGAKARRDTKKTKRASACAEALDCHLIVPNSNDYAGCNKGRNLYP